MDDIQVKVFIPQKPNQTVPKRDRKQEHQQRKLKQQQKKQKYFDKLHQSKQNDQQPQNQISNQQDEPINQENEQKPQRQAQKIQRVPMKQLVIHQKPQSVALPQINLEQEGEVFTEQFFEDLQIHSNVKLGLKSSEYIKMTKIQQLAIPIVDTKANTFIKSETGSGKTLAYMVLLNYLLFLNYNQVYCYSYLFFSLLSFKKQNKR